MKKKTVPVLLAVLLLAVIVALISLISRVVEKYTPSDERVDTAEYFGISGENEMVLVMQDELLEEKGLLENGTAYLSYEAVKTWLNNRFYWDSSENLMLYTTPEDVIRLQQERHLTLYPGKRKKPIMRL